MVRGQLWVERAPILFRSDLGRKNLCRNVSYEAAVGVLGRPSATLKIIPMTVRDPRTIREGASGLRGCEAFASQPGLGPRASGFGPERTRIRLSSVTGRGPRSEARGP